jgi:hypothetical protein
MESSLWLLQHNALTHLLLSIMEFVTDHNNVPSLAPTYFFFSSPNWKDISEVPNIMQSMTWGWHNILKEE